MFNDYNVSIFAPIIYFVFPYKNVKVMWTRYNAVSSCKVTLPQNDALWLTFTAPITDTVGKDKQEAKRKTGALR